MGFKELTELFGLLDAVLIIALVFVWREWRKSENRIINELHERISADAEMIKQYNSFESVLKELATLLKE